MLNVGQIVSDGFVRFRNLITGLVGNLGFRFLKEKITDHLLDEIFNFIKIEIAAWGKLDQKFVQEEVLPWLDELKKKIDDKI